MKSPLRLVVSLAGVLAVTAPVSAQSARPERPYRGLFGGGVGDAEQLLTFQLSLGGGYDDNVFAGQGLSGDPRTARAGEFGSASADLAYSFNSTGWSFGASAGTNTRYSPGVTEDVTTGVSAGAGVSGALWRGARINASGSAGYQPYFTLALIPSFVDAPLGDAPLALPEFAALQDDYLSYSGNIGISQAVSRRRSLAFNVNATRSDFRSGQRADVTTIGASGGYTHNLAKGLALRLGYGLREARTDARTARTRVHSIDVGVDYNRAISFSRRTSLGFSTGTSAVSNGNDPRYHVIGNVGLRHEIGRTWSATAGYDRRVQFVDALADSYLADSALITLGGLVNRRLQFRSQVSVGFAHPGRASGAKEFDSYLGAAGLEYAVTRSMALGVDYSYYRYEFAPGAALMPGFGRRFDRQSVRAQLSFWAPLVHRARRSDAAR